MTHEEILNFIKVIRESIDGAEYIYTHGSCYQFYLILKCIIPESQAYYNSNHVITEINNRYYDITGEVNCTNHLLVDNYYEHEELIIPKYSLRS